MKLKKGLVATALAVVVAGGIGTGVANAATPPPAAPTSSTVDSPTPGDTPDAAGAVDAPTPGDTPDAPGA